MLFRPEEIHTASGLAPGYFTFQNFSKRDIHVSHGRRRIDFQDILVPHADKDGFSTIQTTGIDTNLSSREKPAHGQHLDPSLAVPLLLPLYGHQMMSRYIGKRRPGLDVISLFNKPAGYGGVSCFVLYLPGLFGWQSEGCSKFRIMWRTAGLNKVL